ncbi:MAG: CPBP family intramembrane glutamic endopeptidase, partial [Myxococcota bacterium]
PPLTRELASAGTGTAFALLVILFTRFAVQRTDWARRLHRDLRPVAQQLSPVLILAVAVLSSSGEELLFRSLLTPWIGVVPQAIIFGLFHQLPGPSRWVWVIWATVAGFAFGAMYEVFGTLTGPILSHGLINAVNLMYLRSHDPDR